MISKAKQSKIRSLTLPVAQTGVVLVMALVMLTVLTLIGITSMSSSTLEMKIAGNMQQRNTAFQAAQSRLAFASSDDMSNPINYLIAIPDLKDRSTWPVQTCNLEDFCVNADDWLAKAEVRYSSCSKGIGSSLEAGKGFSYRVFEIEGTGETLTGSSKSVQMSAILYPVNGCGDEML